MTKLAILVNTNRCTGCWTCSLSCKVGNKLEENEWWQHVRTIGSGKGVDEPGGVWPDVYMKWLPIWSTKCGFCGQRVREGEEPFCVFNCPTKALTFGDLDELNNPVTSRIQELEARDFIVYQLPEWEQSRKSIYYAEKKER